MAFATAARTECRRPTPVRSFGRASPDLAAAFGDGVRDPAFPHMLSLARRRVRLVGQEAERFGVRGAVVSNSCAR